MNPLMQIGTRSGGLENIAALMNMMRGKDPNAVMQMMAQRNPQFKAFMEECRGKTPEQVAQQYGVDLNALKQLMK